MASSEPTYTSAQCLKAWSDLYWSLHKEILPQFYVETLCQRRVITEEEFKEGQYDCSRIDRSICSREYWMWECTEWLYQLVKKRVKVKPHLMQAVIESLRHDAWYEGLATTLRRRLAYHRVILVDVPQPLQNYVHREKLQKKIRFELEDMNNWGK